MFVKLHLAENNEVVYLAIQNITAVQSVTGEDGSVVHSIAVAFRVKEKSETVQMMIEDRRRTAV